MKLTKEQIKEIKALRKEGKTIIGIARKFNVSRYTIKWHTDENYREKQRVYSRKLEKKIKRWKNRKDYQREYQKKRYHSDSEFRKKQIERAKVYQKNNTLLP